MHNRPAIRSRPKAISSTPSITCGSSPRQGLQADGEGSAARGDRRDGEDGGRFNGSVQQPGAEQPRFEAADGDAEPEAAEAVPPSRQRSRRSNGSGEATRQAVDESADGPAVDEPSADGGQEEAAVEAS